MSEDRILTELAAVLAALEQARAERAEILSRLENVEATAKFALEEVRSPDRICSQLLLRVAELEREREQGETP